MSRDKIVSLRERLENKKQKEQLEQYRGKVETVQKMIQCSSCHVRCAMCGHHVKAKDASTHPHTSSLGLTFCASCKREFEDFLSISRGKEKSEVFWHNKEWIKMWSAWLNYRQAMTAFVDSPEFKLLLEELNV